MIAEEIKFDDIQVGDLIDVQWELAERQADPTFSLPHSDLLYLQDRTFKRCLVVSMTRHLAEQWTSKINLKTLSSHDQCFTNISAQGIVDEVILNLGMVPPLAKEVLSTSGTSINPYIHFSNIKSWNTISSVYHALLKPLLRPTESIRSIAQQWTRQVKKWNGQKSDRRRYEAEAISALYYQMTHGIRYIGLEFGRHSFEPTSPELTLQRQLGDCKDRAALLISLCASLKIPMHFVMARTLTAGHLEQPGVASLSSFDHALVYSPTLQQYIDATLPDYDINVLPTPLHGAQALHVDGLIKGSNPKAIPIGQLVEMPSPVLDQIGVTLSLIINSNPQNSSEDFSIQASNTTGPTLSTHHIQLSVKGEEARKARRYLAHVPKSDFESLLKNHFPQLNHPQIKLVDNGHSYQLPFTDPIVFNFSITEASSEEVELWREVMTIDLSSQLSSLIGSDRQTPLQIPMSRQIRCVYVKKSTQHIPTTLEMTRPPMVHPKISHQWGRVSSLVDHKKIDLYKGMCLELSVNSQVIQPLVSQDFKKWIDVAEISLNKSIGTVIQSVTY